MARIAKKKTLCGVNIPSNPETTDEQENFIKKGTLRDNLFTSLAWKELEAHREIHTAAMVYKSLNGLATQYLNSLFPYRNEVSSNSIRDSERKLVIPLPRTNYVKNSFSYRDSVLWNSLPNELRQAANSFRIQGVQRHGCSKK